MSRFSAKYQREYRKRLREAAAQRDALLVEAFTLAATIDQMAAWGSIEARAVCDRDPVAMLKKMRRLFIDTAPEHIRRQLPDT